MPIKILILSNIINSQFAGIFQDPIEKLFLPAIGQIFPTTKVQKKVASIPGNVEDAKTLVTYAYSSYCNTERVKTWSCNYYCLRPEVKSTKFYGMASNSNERVNVLINEEKKWIVSTFEGTNNAVTAVKDMYTSTIPITNYIPSFIPNATLVMVHQGFVMSYEGMRDAYIDIIRSLIKNENYKDYKYIFTGHSSGGSLASIAMLDVRTNLNIKNVEFYSYGQPRTGNIYFVNYINSLPLKITRVVNPFDMIPYTPLKAQSFLHFHTQLQLSSNMKNQTFCKTDTYEDANCNGLFLKNEFNHSFYWDLDGRNNC